MQQTTTTAQGAGCCKCAVLNIFARLNALYDATPPTKTNFQLSLFGSHWRQGGAGGAVCKFFISFKEQATATAIAIATANVIVISLSDPWGAFVVLRSLQR